MKRQLFAQILTATVLALGAIPTVSQHGHAQDRPTYFCGTTSNGVPATMVRASERNIPIILWISTSFLPLWPPQRRCQEVSRRFETYSNNGMLNYLTHGYMNNYPVVCATRTAGGPCEGLLFTLMHGRDPNSIIRELLNLRQRNRSGSTIPTDVELGIGGTSESEYIAPEF